MGEAHEYWCARCGSCANHTIRIGIAGLTPTSVLSMKERVCNSLDCAADVIERFAKNLRMSEPTDTTKADL